MRLLKSYTDNFSLKVMRPVDRVIAALQLHVDKSKRNSVIDKFFYGERYQLTNGTFKITRQKAYFDPFRVIGQINLELLPGDTCDETKVLIRTKPLRSHEEGFAFLVFGLIIFTALGLLISVTFYTVVVVVFGWTFFIMTFHFRTKWNKEKLRTYSYTFLRKVIDQSERTTSVLRKCGLDSEQSAI